MSSDLEEVFKQLEGAKVVGVGHAKLDPCNYDRTDSVEIAFEDGRLLNLTLDGDCCSQSSFEDVTQFDELVGAKIQRIEERFGEDDPFWQTLRPEQIDPELINRELSLNAKISERQECVDVVTWHFLVFVTNRGHVTIDWRNDSNGYYDGTLQARLEIPEGN